MNIHVLVNNPGQLKAALSCDAVSEIYAEADVFDKTVIEKCHNAGKKCMLALPYILRGENAPEADDYDGVLARSADELALYSERYMISDYGLYAMNQKAAEFLREHGADRITAPVELNEHELYDLNITDKEIIVYGYIPMMVTAQCIKKNTGSCEGKRGLTYITDRKGNRLPVENKCSYCYNLIYNPVPLSLFGIMDKVIKLKPDSIRINFTVEDEPEAGRILTEMKDPDTYTRGHFTRGVE